MQMPSQGGTSPQHHTHSETHDCEENREQSRRLLSASLQRSGQCAVLSLPPNLLLLQSRVPGRTGNQALSSGIPMRKARKPQVPRSTLPASLPTRPPPPPSLPSKDTPSSVLGAAGGAPTAEGGGQPRGWKKPPAAAGGVPFPRLLGSRGPPLGVARRGRCGPGLCTAPVSLVPQVGAHSLPFSSFQSWALPHGPAGPGMRDPRVQPNGREARAPGFPEKALGLGWEFAWLGPRAPGLKTARGGEELGSPGARTPGSSAGEAGGPVEPRDWRLLCLCIGCAARPLAQHGPMRASGGRALVLMLPSVGVAGMRRREQPP